MKIILLLLVCLYSASRLNAQEATVVTTIMPPYDVPFGDFKNQINATVINTSQTNPLGSVFLRFDIKREGDIIIGTRNGFDPFTTQFDLGEQESRNFNGLVGDFDILFDIDNLMFQNISSQEIFENGLPEGFYEFCFQLISSDFTLITENCATFTINAPLFDVIEPPQLIAPICDTEITTPTNNIVFSWTIPPGSDPLINSYTLKIVELLPGQDPNQAFLSATVPAFYENTVQAQNSILYGPTDPPLEKGKMYAWQVIVENDGVSTFENNGRSQVCWFMYNPTTIDINTQDEALQDIGGPPEVFDIKPQAVPISTFTGKLYYKFINAQDVTSGITAGSSEILTTNQSITLNQLPSTNFKVSPENAKPLANVSVSLVITYLFKGHDNQDNTFNFSPVNDYTNTILNSEQKKYRDRVLATTITDQNGNFSFTGFINPHEDYGLIQSNINSSQGGEMGAEFKGNLYKVLRLKVNNQYYLSPEDNIILNPFKKIELKEPLVSLVKSYGLKIIPKWNIGKTTSIKEEGLSNIKIAVSRGAYMPNHIPADEGNIEKHQGTILGKIIEEGRTEADGLIFKNLIRHNPTDLQDRYHIMALHDDQSSVSFKNTRKRYVPYPHDKDFPYASAHHVSSSGTGLVNIGEFQGDNSTWNSEYTYKTYVHNVYLEPDHPAIYGKLELANSDSQETRILSGDRVVLLERYKNNVYKTKQTITNKTGRFKFKRLNVEHQDVADLKSTVTGPARSWWPSIKGLYGSPKLRVKEAMNWGDQIPEDQGGFQMIPDGYLAGYVVDEEDNPIKAFVNVDDLSVAETKTAYSQTSSNSPGFRKVNSTTNFLMGMIPYEEIQPDVPAGTEWFKMRAPTGERLLTVKAISGNDVYKLFIDSTVTIAKDKDVSLIKITLIKKKKRVRFKVIDKETSKSIQRAIVTLEKGNPSLETHQQFSDSQGYVTFIFSSNVDDFNFTIEPPKGKEDVYVINDNYQVKDLQNSAEVKTLDQAAALEPMAQITGTVTANNKIVPGAEVFFKIGDKKISATTNDQGKYQLRGISKGKGTIQLSATKSGYKTAQTQFEIKSKNTIDFKLEIEKEFYLDEIFGYKTTIISKKKQKDGTYIISEGHISDLPETPNFKVKESTSDKKGIIPFYNLKVKKSGTVNNQGVPIYIPIKDKVTLGVETIALLINKSFVGYLGEENQLLTLTNTNNKGEISGKVVIHNSSFNKEQGYISFESDKEIYLTTSPEKNELKITAISFDNSLKDRFGIADKEGNDLSYDVGGFKAQAIRKQSYLEKDNIVLYTHLKTEKIDGIIPEQLELEAGELILKPQEIIPIKNENPLKIKLEAWDFIAENWSYNPEQNRIQMSSGTIKTNLLNVPVKGISIYPKKFDISGKFQLDNLTVGGIAKLNIATDGITSFDLNPSTGTDKKKHWELKITSTNDNNPVATLALPGFDASNPIGFSSIKILSNNEQQTSLGNNSPIKFHNIIEIKPDAIVAGDNYIDLLTTTNLGIPGVPVTSGFIRYTKEGNTIKPQVSPIKFALNAPGKVVLTASDKLGDSKIQKDLFQVKGRLTDAEGIRLDANLIKTPSDIKIEILPNQKMKLGGATTAFKDIEGGLHFDKTKNEWTKLSFSGELEGFKGVKPGQRQRFTVHGDITADKESIGVNNIDTPFGDLALTYDIKNSRFIGHLNIDKDLGGTKFVGAANVLIGKEGWYFTAGGKATPPGFGELSVGLIIGDSDFLAPKVSQNLMQFAYNKEIPPTIRNGVSGLFVTGRKDLPIINIPDWEIDLKLASARLGAYAGVDARIWMDFDSSGNEYGIGAMAFARIYFSMSSIIGTKLDAEARAELGLKGMYQTKTKDFSLDGCGSFTISGRIEQWVPEPLKGGWLTFKFSKGIITKMHLDSSGNTDLSFDFGDNCSGIPPLSNNW